MNFFGSTDPFGNTHSYKTAQRNTKNFTNENEEPNMARFNYGNNQRKKLNFGGDDSPDVSFLTRKKLSFGQDVVKQDPLFNNLGKRGEFESCSEM